MVRAIGLSTVLESDHNAKYHSNQQGSDDHALDRHDAQSCVVPGVPLFERPCHRIHNASGHEQGAACAVHA